MVTYAQVMYTDLGDYVWVVCMYIYTHIWVVCIYIYDQYEWQTSV